MNAKKSMVFEVAVGSAPSKKYRHWANVYFSAHEFAQPRRHI